MTRAPETTQTVSADTARARLVGVDIARALAIFGMFAAHILVNVGELGWAPRTWDALVTGRSSILFGVLAGVSVALMTGRTLPPTGPALVQARIRLMVRGMLIWVIGGVLDGFVHPVAIILQVYGVTFFLLVPMLRWRVRTLVATALGLIVLGPLVGVGLRWLATQSPSLSPDSSELFTMMVDGPYAGFLWLGLGCIGLAAGRADLTARRTQLTLLGAGTLGMLIGYGGSALLGDPTVEVYTAPPAPRDGPPVDFNVTDALAALLVAEPHSGSPTEGLGSGGFALTVLAICLLLPPAVTRALRPIAAVGSMALTVYVVQILALVWVDPRTTADNDVLVLASFVVVAMLLATFWSTFVGRGPLETLLRLVADAAASFGPRATAVAQREIPQR